MFEIVKTKGGYAAAPTTLVSFTSIPGGSIPFGALLADAAGNLFGTTSQGGRDNDGTVFEISKTKHGYASTPTTLVSFKGADGANPFGSLIADAKGDLIGTTAAVTSRDPPARCSRSQKTRGGYASAPTVLASFTGPMGSNPSGNLIADAAGDLFGTTETGAYGYGTVFEIVKTNSGYAAPTSLVYFTAKDGDQPAGLTIDASGNLFGVAHFGGPDNDGNVFEIAKVNGGYAGVTKIVNFTGLNGTDPNASLIADAAGGSLRHHVRRRGRQRREGDRDNQQRVRYRPPPRQCRRSSILLIWRRGSQPLCKRWRALPAMVRWQSCSVIARSGIAISPCWPCHGSWWLDL